MESEKEKMVFPPPPDYYQEFTTPDKYDPPKLSILNKFDRFTTFGNEFSTKELNVSYNPVNISDKMKKFKMSNLDFFNEIQNKDSLNINCDNFTFNVIEELEKEIKYLKTRYKRLLQDMNENIKKAPSKIEVIGVCIQKINFYLIALRRKAILKKAIDFYNKGIDDCVETSTKIDEGIKNLTKYIEENLKNFKNN